MPRLNASSEWSSSHDHGSSMPRALAKPSPCSRPKANTTGIRTRSGSSRRESVAAAASTIDNAITGSTITAGMLTTPMPASRNVTLCASGRSVPG
ncbi:hypothetical protein ASG80_20490 [Agromyces sp. Soil535]|nr:hypothetical protein ASG80_20490 [Agromyces sp. Soil535]